MTSDSERGPGLLRRPSLFGRLGHPDACFAFAFCTPFALPPLVGKIFDAGIDLFMNQHGDTIAGRKVEIVGGPGVDATQSFTKSLTVTGGAILAALRQPLG